MTSRNGTRIVTIEEHYVDPEVRSQLAAGGSPMIDGPLGDRLDDLGQGELRIREMDEAGIDVQILSHAPPATQWMDPAIAVPLARRANDRLKRAVDAYPTRFGAFAALPTSDPMAAVGELDRCVTQLGFKGAMIYGQAAGQVFFDDRRFWPLFERAAALDVPIYLHPAPPDPRVVQAYLQDYLAEYPNLAGPVWGFTIETATAALRLVLSGVFEAHPNLKIILGHLGEGLPYLLHRISEALSRVGKASKRPNAPTWFRDTFCEHFWITTSGDFSTPALMCAMQELGADRILFSVDWPFMANKPGVEWMEQLAISPEDKRKLLHQNAEKLLRL